ncbi:MAG: glycosyltransferase family 2 protein [Actinomycetota bacterium]|nr:glycosyltransferase family 2 protein [Actinomycetota bacterium]
MTITATALVPAHNEAGTISVLVRALWDSGCFEDVVVVADSCTDDTGRFAREAGATVLETAFQDKALAQNAAIFGPYPGHPLGIGTETVIGFDADTIPTPGCVEQMLADLECGYDATCATVLPIQESGFWVRGRRYAYALARRWWRLCQAKVGRIQVLTGAAYAFRTDALKAIGGFGPYPGNPELISQDMPSSWELHKAGYQLGYTGDAIALTYDPETFRTYRAQMRRWAAGYAQTMAAYRRQLWNWRSALVVWTALFDLASLFVWEGLLIWALASGHTAVGWTVLTWVAARTALNTVLVATVVGAREALLGVVPYTVVNVLHRWWYTAALVREWVLGRRYASWTGRQGRRTVITPMAPRRAYVLGLATAPSVVLLAAVVVA